MRHRLEELQSRRKASKARVMDALTKNPDKIFDMERQFVNEGLLVQVDPVTGKPVESSPRGSATSATPLVSPRGDIENGDSAGVKDEPFDRNVTTFWDLPLVVWSHAFFQCEPAAMSKTTQIRSS